MVRNGFFFYSIFNGTDDDDGADFATIQEEEMRSILMPARSKEKGKKKLNWQTSPKWK